MNKTFKTVAHALEGVEDGATIMFGGFVSAGTPTNLIHALRDRGTKDITAIANNIGFGDRLDILCGSRQISKMIASFAIRASSSKKSSFEELYKLGLIDLELVPQGTLAERIRAGGAGIPAFYTPTGVGTVVESGKERRDFDGRTYLLELALRADFALIKAHRADTMGNLVYRGAGRNFCTVMAMASTITVAEVDEIVEAGSIDPDVVATPGIFVQRIVQAPRIDLAAPN